MTIDFKNIADVAYYEGFEDQVLQLLSYIRVSLMYDKKSTIIGYPEFLNKQKENTVRMIWWILVKQFGNYGSSPRFGWLEKERVEPYDRDILEILKSYTSQEIP